MAAQEFFTPEALGQLSGAVAVVTAVSVTFRRLTGLNILIIPFAVSLIVAYIAAGTTGTLHSVPLREFPGPEFFKPMLGWLLPFLNACLLFISVIGVTEVVAAVDKRAQLERHRNQVVKLERRLDELSNSEGTLDARDKLRLLQQELRRRNPAANEFYNPDPGKLEREFAWRTHSESLHGELEQELVWRAYSESLRGELDQELVRLWQELRRLRPMATRDAAPRPFRSWFDKM